jgi:hypothetical protein
MKSLVRLSVGWIHHIQSFCSSIVSKTYPFAHTVDGKKLYLQEAYVQRAAQAGSGLYKAPYARPALPITIWRQFLELWLAIFFWMITSAIERVIGLPWGLILPALVILYFLYQEIYIDSEVGRQNWILSFVDALLWTIPSVLFIVSVLF